MSLPKIVYSVKVSDISDEPKWEYELLFPPTDIKLFYKKEDAENFARIKVLEKLEEYEILYKLYREKGDEEFEKISKMSWELMQSMCDIWFKGQYIPYWYVVKIEETEIE